VGTGNNLVLAVMEQSLSGKMSPAHEAERKFLTQQVDFWMEAQLRRDAPLDAKNQYWRAKEDLTKFISSRRKEGYKI